MPPVAPEELYRRWIEQIWGGATGAISGCVAPRFVGHWPDRTVTGRDGLASVIGRTRSMFDSLTFRVELGPMVQGDLVAARWTGVGTGDDGETRFAGHDIMRIANGQIAEYWVQSSVSVPSPQARQSTPG